jgi:hypothetical protein
MSMFAQLDRDTRQRGTEQLGADLASGRWDEKYGAPRALTEIDLGTACYFPGEQTMSQEWVRTGPD